MTSKPATVKAVWHGATLATSDATVEVEGNHYFPPQALDQKYIIKSNHQTVCGWKGTASYYHIEVDGVQNPNAAWYYPDPKPEAAKIKDHVAFWKGVTVEPV